MIPADVLATAKKLGIEHPRDVNHDGKIDMTDLKAMKAAMDKSVHGGDKK